MTKLIRCYWAPRDFVVGFAPRKVGNERRRAGGEGDCEKEEGERGESVSCDVWRWCPRRVFSTVALHHALTSISWNLIYPASLKATACARKAARNSQKRGERILRLPESAEDKGFVIVQRVILSFFLSLFSFFQTNRIIRKPRQRGA